MKLRTLSHAIMICAALGATAAIAATAVAPTVTATTRPSPLPLPYNERGDAQADVAAAVARAKAAGKYVLLDFGGNWCPDCRVLAGVLDLKEVKPAVLRTFEVAQVDVGRFDKNLDIPARYGVKVTAVPLVIILDSGGRFINAGNPTALSNARDMSNQSIVDTIFGWLSARPQESSRD